MKIADLAAYKVLASPEFTRYLEKGLWLTDYAAARTFIKIYQAATLDIVGGNGDLSNFDRELDVIAALTTFAENRQLPSLDPLRHIDDLGIEYFDCNRWYLIRVILPQYSLTLSDLKNWGC